MHQEREAEYRQMLEINPLDIHGLHHLSVLLYNTGRAEEGLCLIVQALNDESNSAGRLNDLGNILTQLGELSHAEEAFHRSLNIEPNNANLWTNLGAILQQQNKLEAAESAYRSALGCDNDFLTALQLLSSLLADTGRKEESCKLACLAYIKLPKDQQSFKILSGAYYTLGRLEEAKECYRTWLEEEPENPIALHRLAALKGHNVPERANDQYIQSTFDEMADYFEEKLINELQYNGPESIKQLLDKQFTKSKTLRVLDAGCGTGLSAAALSEYAYHLTGVDLSPNMLSKASSKNIYDDLIESEITSYLMEHQSSFDLIVMVDLMIYFGPLDNLFKAVKKSLGDKGYLAFTLESEKMADPFKLRFSGRFAHSLSYIESLCALFQFKPISINEIVIRTELVEPITGHLVLLQSR